MFHYLFSWMVLLKRIFFCFYNYECCCDCWKADPKRIYSNYEKWIPVIIFFVCIAGILGFCITGFVFTSKIKPNYRVVKCSIAVSFFEFINGASSFSIYGTKWAGFKNIMIESKNQISSLNTKLQQSNLKSDLNSGTYQNECPTISSVETKLNELFGLSSSSSSVIQSPSRTTKYSLIPSEAGIDGTYKIEFDSNSITNYPLLINAKILEEYKEISTSVPIILKSVNSILQNNPLPAYIKKLEDFSKLDTDIKKFKSELIQTLSNQDSIVNATTIIVALFFTFHLILIIAATFSIIYYTFKEVKCLRNLNNCCWIAFVVAVIIGFALSILLIICAVFVQDVCNFISFESITSSKFKASFKELFPSGDEMIDVCFAGDGNFANVIGLNDISDLINDLVTGIQGLGKAFFGENPELLPILDINIGTRIDHCCISQVDSTMKECSGLFPYSAYMDSNSLLNTLNEASQSCTSSNNFMFVFYHPKTTQGIYDDCPSGTYSSVISSSTNNQCLVLSEIEDGPESLLYSIISNCPGSIKNSIQDILPKLRKYAQNIYSRGSDYCSKFYGGSSSFQGYDNSNPNNLFALFKKNTYISNSKCDTKILKDVSLLIKDVTDLPMNLANYIKGQLNCLLLKDIIYRLNLVLCTNFRSTINVFFLMIILITFFELLIIFLITFINRTFKRSISEYTDNSPPSTISKEKDSPTKRNIKTDLSEMEKNYTP